MPEGNRVRYPREAFSFAGTNTAIPSGANTPLDLSTNVVWDALGVLGTTAYDVGGQNPLTANHYVRLPAGVWYVLMSVIWASDVTGVRGLFTGIQDNRYYPNNFNDPSIDPFAGDFGFAMGALIGDHARTGADLALTGNQETGASILIVSTELVNLADSASLSGEGAVHNFIVVQTSGAPLNINSWFVTGVKIGDCE